MRPAKRDPPGCVRPGDLFLDPPRRRRPRYRVLTSSRSTAACRPAVSPDPVEQGVQQLLGRRGGPTPASVTASMSRSRSWHRRMESDRTLPGGTYRATSVKPLAVTSLSDRSSPPRSDGRTEPNRAVRPRHLGCTRPAVPHLVEVANRWWSNSSRRRAGAQRHVGRHERGDVLCFPHCRRSGVDRASTAREVGEFRVVRPFRACSRSCETSRTHSSS